jgi:hypothetical protein
MLAGSKGSISESPGGDNQQGARRRARQRINPKTMVQIMPAILESMYIAIIAREPEAKATTPMMMVA